MCACVYVVEKISEIVLHNTLCTMPEILRDLSDAQYSQKKRVFRDVEKANDVLERQ